MRRGSLSVLGALAMLALPAPAAAGSPQPEESHGRCPGSAAVTASWEEARRLGVEFRAVGLAPRWTLELLHGQCFRFIDHEAARLVSASMPAPLREVRTGGLLYGARSEAHDLQVGIERKDCPGIVDADPMSHTVMIRLDGKEYSGCGRSLP